MLFENANLLNSEANYSLRQSRKLVTKLRVGVRIRGSSERNPFLDCEFGDPVTRVRFIHRLAPAGRGKFDREIVVTNKIECLVRQARNICTRPVTMDLDEIKVSKTIDQSRRRNFADPSKVICIDRIDIPAFELRGAIRYAVEHLVIAIEEVN